MNTEEDAYKIKLKYLLRHNVKITKFDLDVYSEEPEKIDLAIKIYNYIKTMEDTYIYLCFKRDIINIEKIRDNRPIRICVLNDSLLFSLKQAYIVMERFRKKNNAVFMDALVETANARTAVRICNKLDELELVENNAFDLKFKKKSDSELRNKKRNEQYELGIDDDSVNVGQLELSKRELLTQLQATRRAEATKQYGQIKKVKVNGKERLFLNPQLKKSLQFIEDIPWEESV